MRKKILVLDDKIAIAKVLSIYLASDYELYLVTEWHRRGKMASGR